MVQPLLPHHVSAPSPQHHIDDLHGSSVAQQPLAQLSQKVVDLAVRAQLRKAAVSRSDINAFFEFVFREETTRARLRTLPHQRVIYKFIRHYRFCLLRLPTGFGKTYTMAADGLWVTGRDVTQRGMFLSAAEAQAEKPLLAMRSYIESSPEIRLVFPELRPSEDHGDPWTQNAITVARPMGIRFPTASAVGLDSKTILGTRLSWLNIDDVLDEENTHTDEQRKKTTRFIKTSGLSRLDADGSRCIFTQTPWHPEDATYQLEKLGWPSLNMDCWGGVWFVNADDFDCEEIRPSRDAAQEEGETGVTVASRCRLVAHDGPAYARYAIERADALKAFQERGTAAGAMDERSSRGRAETERWTGDDEEQVPLWPERWDVPKLVEKRAVMGGEGSTEWARTMEIKAVSDEDRKIKDEWIERAKSEARKLGYTARLSTWSDSASPVITGVDLGFGKGKKSGNVAVFSFAVMTTLARKRLLLGVDVFKYQGGNHALKIIRSHHDNYGSTVALETNAAQRLLKEWGLEADAGLRLTSFETNRNKHHPSFGVESMFLEFENGAWLIPAASDGRVDKGTAHWLEDLKNYRVGEHTGDAFMASWIARERARLLGLLGKGSNFWAQLQSTGLGGISTR